jgi:hypothetical protein
VYRIVRTRFGVGSAAAAYGGTLYVFNPFIAERYLAGHMFILLALGLLPWALGSVLDLLDDPFGGTSVQVGAWLFGLAAVDLHVAGFYALLVVVAGAAALSRRGAIRARADRQTATAAAAPGGRCRAERGTQGRREGSSWVPDDAALGLDGEPGRDLAFPVSGQLLKIHDANHVVRGRGALSFSQTIVEGSSPGSPMPRCKSRHHVQLDHFHVPLLFDD